MTTLFKLALLGSLAGALLLTNIYFLGAPVETTAIASGVRATGQLASTAVAGGKAGIEHIEGLTFIQTFSARTGADTSRPRLNRRPSQNPSRLSRNHRRRLSRPNFN
jgi:hypothetical protein